MASTAGPSTLRAGTSAAANSAIRVLQLELKSLQREPVDGFIVNVNDDNIFDWRVAIFGPPGTVYEGGYFKARLRFPNNYPYSPPAMKFISQMWHPNVYENGDLCISILHAPVDDPRSGELACERWNPAQNVRTILLSVISLLNEPNTQSPANVDASVMYRKWKDGHDDQYKERVRELVNKSKAEASNDGVKVPTSLEEYTAQSMLAAKKMSSSSKCEGGANLGLDGDFDMDIEDNFYDYYGDDSDDDMALEEENAEDSGQGES